MEMSFEEFRHIIREGEKDGSIKCDVQLTDYELAIHYVIGKICDTKGVPCTTTNAEIWQGLWEYIGEEDPELLEDIIADHNFRTV